MSRHTRATLVAATLLAAAACSDSPEPAGPGHPDLAQGAAWQEPPDPERARDQRLARRVALALSEAGFRAEVLAATRASTQREQRIQLQRFLFRDGHRRLIQMARAAGEAPEAGRTDLSGAPTMEMYFPVPAHRARWQGEADLLVATARRDGEAPVAFDLRGRRHLLDPVHPPARPVLAVQVWEGGDDDPCDGPCQMGIEVIDDDPPVTSPPPPATATGLFLTGARFFDKFEGWLKGAPEFEVHVLGHQEGTTNLVSYQCAGERAGAPYAFNQDELTWSGSVMLFSQAQLDDFQARHPGQGLRFLVLEDDDGPCEIRVNRDRVTTLFRVADAAYSAWTSGQQVKITEFVKQFERARSYYQLVAGLASLFKTNDDLVGTAVEDPGAAGLVLTGARWVVKGENNTGTGALRLVMR